jgi:hypothetical protein
VHSLGRHHVRLCPGRRELSAGGKAAEPGGGEGEADGADADAPLPAPQPHDPLVLLDALRLHFTKREAAQ